jgi:nucleotide-binding universal stress UspA family protein
MFDHILVPIDGSTDSWIALEQAIDIAQEENGLIQGLFVADVRLIEAPYWSAAPPDEANPEVDPTRTQIALKVGRLVSERGQEILAKLDERCAEANIYSTTEYVEGVADRVILDRARRSDLVVLGRRGEGGHWAGPQLGSTFETVVRHAAAPVLAAQAEPRRISRILIAYDGSRSANEALQVAANFAHRHGDDVVLLTVDDDRQGRRQHFANAKQTLAEQGLTGKVFFHEGHAAEVILNTAREEDCDLIAMGAYGHSHFIETFFGSTVDEVVHRAICPVLVCR